MFKLSTPNFAPTKRLLYVLSLFTMSLVMLLGLAGCTYDIGNDSSDKKNCNTKMDPGPAQMLASGLQGTSGSTIGPDGALYVTEGVEGKISRIDPMTGDKTTFAEKLPPLLAGVGIGGPMDVAFYNETAYVIVTLVDPNVGGSEVTGLYRIDGPDTNSLIADIGQFNMDNPPSINFDFFIPSGVQYAIQTYRHGFLVTDGHLNRVLYITLDGKIEVIKSFDNVVPTGLALSGNKIYMAESGPSLSPEESRVVSFVPNSPKVKDVGDGAPMLVDVEFSCGHTLFALSQGDWDGVMPGSPAKPNTGSLVKVNKDGTVTLIKDGLDRPTSLEFIGNTAYIVTLTGEVWTIDNVSGPPYGH